MQRFTLTQLNTLRCGVGHSGNRRLTAERDHTHAQCNGCGKFFTAAQIIDAQSGDAGENGNGSLYRVEA